MATQPCDTPLTADVEDDMVILDGCATALTLTPRAAAETAARLAAAADRAASSSSASEASRTGDIESVQEERQSAIDDNEKSNEATAYRAR